MPNKTSKKKPAEAVNAASMDFKKALIEARRSGSLRHHDRQGRTRLPAASLRAGALRGDRRGTHASPEGR